MHALAITHSIVSLLILIAGFTAWRFTTSRSIAFIALFGSAALLISAYFTQTGKEAELTYIIPFLIASLFAGRAIGFGYRCRTEVELRVPSALLAFVSVTALGASILTYACI